MTIRRAVKKLTKLPIGEWGMRLPSWWGGVLVLASPQGWQLNLSYPPSMLEIAWSDNPYSKPPFGHVPILSAKEILSHEWKLVKRPFPLDPK